jgi:hypothetical protein
VAIARQVAIPQPSEVVSYSKRTACAGANDAIARSEVRLGGDGVGQRRCDGRACACVTGTGVKGVDTEATAAHGVALNHVQ